MTDAQAKRLTLFVSNVENIKSDFFWQSAMMKHTAALLYTTRDWNVDTGAIRRCFDMIKQNTGLFSMFRGNSALTVATMLSLNPDAGRLLSDTLGIYGALKDAGFGASDFLVVAAYQIASGAGANRFAAVVGRTRSFYEGMKVQHPFLTSYDDYIFAAMLGLSDVDTDEGVRRMEQLYRALKPEFFSGNGVQALAQVLILGNGTDTVIDRVLALRQLLRENGLKMESQYTLSSLGVLALLPGTADEIVRDVSEAFEHLRGQRGFGAWSFPKQELELYAAALAAVDHVEAIRGGLVATALTTSITNIIIAQQAAMAAVAASSAATAASSGT